MKQNTKRRGFVFSLPNGEKAAVFVYPLVHKQDNTKNYFDTRDSGAYERGVTWNYAITNNMKYFCIGVNDTVDKYNDYSFSLECNESDIEKISGTLNGSRNGSGNQIIIPNDYVPSKGIERIANKLGIYITAVHKDNLLDYLTYYDNRPYMENSALANLDELVVDDSYVEREDPFKTGYESPFPRNRILFGAPGTGKSFTINSDRVELLGKDKGHELNDILEGIKKLEIVEIILDKLQGDEPQKIFESINSTGLELSLADLIRNYLLMDDENQDELYEEYWLEIEKNVGYRNLGDFVINFLNSQITGSVNSKNAYRLFKEHCQNNGLSHKDVLTALRGTSKYYGAFIGEIECYSARVTKYLNAFNMIKQTTVLPLLFRVFDDYEARNIDENTLCSVLECLLTYFVRTNACEINKNMAKFMKSLYDRVIDGNYEHYYERFVMFLNDIRANDRMPTDKEFREALIYRPLYKKNICKYLLSVIENSTKEHIDVSNLTIEHILPQKENAAVWKKEVGADYGRVYETYLHTLGNLTITGHNSELGTKAFEEKKKIIRQNSKANILNREVLSADTWTEKSILHRAEILADILIEEFKYIEIHSDTNESTELKSLLRLPRQKPKLNLKNIVLFRIGYLCLTLISTCWNWKRMRRSSSLAIEIFSLPRSSAWELGH